MHTTNHVDRYQIYFYEWKRPNSSIYTLHICICVTLWKSQNCRGRKREDIAKSWRSVMVWIQRGMIELLGMTKLFCVLLLVFVRQLHVIFKIHGTICLNFLFFEVNVTSKNLIQDKARWNNNNIAPTKGKRYSEKAIYIYVCVCVCVCVCVHIYTHTYKLYVFI
jgi:hypothetical protein